MASISNNSFQEEKRTTAVHRKEYSAGVQKSIPCIIQETYDRDRLVSEGIPKQLEHLVTTNPSVIYCKVVTVDTNEDFFLPLSMTPEEYYTLYSSLSEMPGEIVYYDTSSNSRHVRISEIRGRALDAVQNKIISFDIGGAL